MPVRIRSFAKVNIGLRIGPPGYRSDGFHELRTVYQTIALHDVLTISYARAGSGIIVRANHEQVPCDAGNTCYKAAEWAMQTLGKSGGIRIEIDKRLPIKGGLGAASANAACTILGVERAVGKRLTAADRLRIAEQVGSDVPLFLVGGTVLGIGRGEQVTPLPDLPRWPLVVATPDIGISTPQAFRDWDELFAADNAGMELAPSHASTSQPHAKLTVSSQSDRLNTFSRELSSWLSGVSSTVSGVPARGGNRAEALLLDLVRTGIENDFERVVFPVHPALRKVKQQLQAQGAQYISLSGSGSAVYGIFSSRSRAEKAAGWLQAHSVPAQVTAAMDRNQYWRALR